MDDPLKGLSAPAPRTDVLAVIPSIGGSDLDSVVQLHRQLLAIERISSVVVSNSRRLTEVLEDLSLPFTTDGVNGGFGRSIRMAVAAEDKWDWLLIVNDDISLDPELFSRALEEYLAKPGQGREIVYFDPDKPRHLPDRFDVFLQVSLLGRLLSRFRRPSLDSGCTYRSFSCVAISRDLYDRCGGFDEDLIFTYEDADFVSRALNLGAVQRVAADSGVIHMHSVSSGMHVDSVLPVATFSAVRYMDKLAGLPMLNSIIAVSALIMRIAFVPLTRADKKKHFHGIYRSVVAVIRRPDVRPELPQYFDL